MHTPDWLIPGLVQIHYIFPFVMELYLSATPPRASRASGVLSDPCAMPVPPPGVRASTCRTGGDYDVTIPDTTESGMYKIRVGVFGDDSVYDCSEAFEVYGEGSWN